MPRAELAADLAALRQNIAHYSAQEQQAQQVVAQMRDAITRTAGAINYLEMKLSAGAADGDDEGAAAPDDTIGVAMPDVTEG